MGKVARALGLEIEWVDARRKEEGFVKWIAERVLEVRKEKVRLMVGFLIYFSREEELMGVMGRRRREG